MTKTILSGMQPTGNLNLGNYLGALKNWVRLQDDADARCLYMVADLHAITVPQDPAELLKTTREITAAFIASGIDPKRSDIFVQSSISAHSELMWLMSSIAQMGKLERMTQFKDKAGKNSERAGLGLFAYPVLMAADILIYKATHVPVGDDQKQHLELSREIASTFNTRFKEGFFPLPEPVIMGPGTRVMSFKDGTKKMSKSDESDNSRINLIDDADTIVRKIKKAKSDADVLPDNMAALDGRPEALNLVNIYAGLSEMTPDAVITEFAGQGFGAFKPALADLAVAKLGPITARMNALMGDPAEIDKVLAAGNEKAAAIAEPVLAEVKALMGFWK